MNWNWNLQLAFFKIFDRRCTKIILKFHESFKEESMKHLWKVVVINIFKITFNNVVEYGQYKIFLQMFFFFFTFFHSFLLSFFHSHSSEFHVRTSSVEVFVRGCLGWGRLKYKKINLCNNPFMHNVEKWPNVILQEF